MIDFGSIAAAVSGLKTAGDIAKGMLDLKAAGDVQGKVIELQNVILNAQSSALAAQSEQMILLQRVGELEKQVSRAEAWEAEVVRYKLKDYGDGRFAYELKSEAANGDPPHRLCTTCFHAGKKSILQFHYRVDQTRAEFYDCHGCGLKFRF